MVTTLLQGIYVELCSYQLHQPFSNWEIVIYFGGSLAVRFIKYWMSLTLLQVLQITLNQKKIIISCCKLDLQTVWPYGIGHWISSC